MGVVLDPSQKLEIAGLLDGLGVDRIEAGFPRVSPEDWEAVSLIAAAASTPRSGSPAPSPPTSRRSSHSACASR